MATAPLSSFWRRRLHALPALAATPARRGRWLGAAGLVLLAVPLALPRQPETTAPKAGAPLYRPPRPPADEPAEKRAARAVLHTAYALADGERLKLVVPPFPPERATWLRVVDGRVTNPNQAQQLGWVWDEHTIDDRFGSYGGSDGDDAEPVHHLVNLVALTLRLRHSEIEGPGRELLDRKSRAEVVIRAGTTREQAVEPLARGLREQVRLPVRLTLRTERREVWVARGKVQGDPPPGSREDDPILIYGKEPPPPVSQQPRAVVMHGSGWDGLLDYLGVYLGRQVFADAPVSPPTNFVYYRLRRDRSADPADEDAVIKKVAEQTGLTFTRERRDVRVLWVEKVE
jgi:hypothetical protein